MVRMRVIRTPFIVESHIIRTSLVRIMKECIRSNSNRPGSNYMDSNTKHNSNHPGSNYA